MRSATRGRPSKANFRRVTKAIRGAKLAPERRPGPQESPHFENGLISALWDIHLTAIEILEPKGFGRCRMAPVADASSELLRSFVLDNVEPGATVITDAWQGYRWLEKRGYIHDRRSQRAASTRGEDPGELLPGVHRIASLAKRWLLGTHQGAVDSAHLPSYLDEFVFRFNRRRSRSRGMLFYRVLELAVAHGPVRYQDLVMSQSPKAVPPKPPRHRGHPPSLERPSPNRPWRQIVHAFRPSRRANGEP